MSIELRDYQNELINKVYKSISEGNKRIMVQSPAGSGKSVTMSEIARRATKKKNRVLFVVHRRELVSQIKETFAANNVDFKYCHVGMIQTVRNKLKKNKEVEPSLILVDEAHHSLAKSYMDVFNTFPNAYVLGFTATPWRMANVGFTHVFQDLILGKTVQWLIDNERLSPFKYFSVNLMDKSKLKKNSTGDYSTKSIDDAMEKVIYGDIVENYRKFANGKKTIIYVHRVRVGKELAEEFKKSGFKAKEVDGKTDKETRESAMKMFRNGDLTILINADLYGEGIDVPDCECVVLARPTESLTLFIQQTMRSMRYMPKKEAIIIDHVGNYLNHGLPSSEHDWINYFKGKKKNKNQSENEITVKQCENCFGVYSSKENKCPMCGHVPEVKEQKDYELVKDVELEEITQDSIIQLDFREPSDCKNMKELYELAENRGYKKGWAYFQGKLLGFIK